jgi:RNA polymerase sigma-70 factor (ECF subfamily)
MTTETEQQFTESYDRYAEDLLRYSYYRVFDREKAKDFVQESYCRVWKYLSEGKEIINIRAFLYKTCYHLIVDESRKNKSISLSMLMEKGFTPSIDPRETMDKYLAHDEIATIMKTVDEKYRNVIQLKYLDDLSAKEIAKLLKDTENNVYVRISRGFKKIRLQAHAHA